MLRYSAIAGLAMIVSIFWFSASQSLETPARLNEIRTVDTDSIRSLQQKSELTIPINTFSINRGTVSLTLAAGNDSFLIISSDDSEAQIAPLSVTRRPLSGQSMSRWSMDSLLISHSSKIDEFSSIPRRVERQGVTSDGLVNSQVSKSQAFFIHVTDGPFDDPRQYATVRSRTIEEGKYVCILLDRQEPESERLKTLAQRIRSEFEQTIIPKCTEVFGTWRDVDGDGKLTILLTPWLGKLQGGKTSLNGFVRGADFDERIAAPLGSRADVIYLNSNLSPTADLRSLLGHEYFHVLQCSLRGSHSNLMPLEEDWLSEAQAHLAEQWLEGDDSNLKHRIEAFLASPGSAPLVVRDYYRAGRWRDDGCRGATFLFLQWCASREGIGFLKQMLRSPEVGVRGLETVTGQRFSELHRAWAISMLSSAIADEDVSARSEPLSVNSRISRHSIPWSHLEVTPLAERDRTVRTSVAPTAVRFFKISASKHATCLQVESEVDHPLQLTLIDVEQLAQLNSAHEKDRLEEVAAGLENSSDSIR